MFRSQRHLVNNLDAAGDKFLIWNHLITWLIGLKLGIIENEFHQCENHSLISLVGGGLSVLSEYQLTEDYASVTWTDNDVKISEI